MYVRKIASIRRFITTESCESLVSALITSRLDYANSVLYELPKCQIKRLQRVQNMAARIVRKVGKFEHVTPIMYELHWLPLHERIGFKIIMMTFKILHGHAPGYLEQLLELYFPERQLRSSTNHYQLTVPRYNTRTYGYRSFSVAAPTLWNRLPNRIRSITEFQTFKKSLKTHLFRSAYNIQ